MTDEAKKANGTKKKRGKPPGSGRKKGTPNKVTKQARDVCAKIIQDPKYRAMLMTRARTGQLPPAVETMLWHYAHGKPKERVQVEGQLSWAQVLLGVDEDK